MCRVTHTLVVLCAFVVLSVTPCLAMDLYFPHIASTALWETEVGISNVGGEQLRGILRAYDDDGILIESLNIVLNVGGKNSMIVGDVFQHAEQITNIKFSAESSECIGYEKFYQGGQRVAIPAVEHINTSDLYVSHIASGANWWTGLALLNTTATDKVLTVTFNDGSQYPLALKAGQHWAGTIQGSFPNVVAEQLESAVISNASGVIGLELFGSKEGTGNHYLSGISLSNQTATTLYYPHVASNSLWWTGIVAYNPNRFDVSVTVTPYSDQGEQLEGQNINISAKGKYVGTALGLNLPSETAWFKLDSSAPVTGFELFGSQDGKQLGGYNVVNINTTAGVFSKRDSDGWTGIAFVNIEPTAAAIALTALNDAGDVVASATLNLAANGKQVALAENFFESDISTATSIKFNANNDIVGFQLNGSSNGYMLDALPGLSSFSSAAIGNQPPYAASITRQLDVSIPYLQQQLIGNDPDYDTILYELVSPETGAEYSLAYINPTTGVLYLTYETTPSESFSILYRVTDSQLYSETAHVTITIDTNTDVGRGTGNLEVDARVYSLFDRSTYSSELLGTLDGTPIAPSSIDLSHNFPDPGNQGSQGSCVGWATAYALKSYQEKVEIGWALNTPSHLFSPAYLYNQINGGQDNGSYINEALDLAVNQGIASLATAPYDDSDYLTQPTGLARAEASLYKAVGWSTIGDTTQIKAALANRKPVIVGIEVYDSFQSLSGTASVYNTKAGENLGGHAVTIVGYDNNKYGGSFKVINSWGTGWGDSGYFWMPYSFTPQVLKYAYILIDGENSDTVSDDVQTTPDLDYSQLPNLSVSSWATSYDPRPGGQGTLTYTVTNIGLGVAPSGADINLMLSKDRHINSNDYYVMYEPIPFDLDSGGAAYRDGENPITFEFPDQIEAGIYYMALWLDDLNTVQESNENDNVSIGDHSITIQNSLADLDITTWYADWDSNGNGQFTYGVKNNSDTPIASTDWWINFVLDPDLDITNGNEHYLFYEKAGYELGPQSAIYRDDDNPAYFNLFQTANGDPVPEGTYYLAIWVDDYNIVAESNEVNNVSYSWGTVDINSSARQRQAEGAAVSENQRAYNGQVLPSKDVLLQKIEITRTADGGTTLKMLNDRQPVVKDGTGSSVPSKTMRSKSNLIFPTAQKIAMPHRKAVSEK